MVSLVSEKRFSVDVPSQCVCVLIILGVVGAVFLPIAFMGIPDDHDLTQHIRFAASYGQAILSGQIIPKWAGYDNYGFGSIGVRYYPPLSHTVLAIAKIITDDWYTSFWSTSFGWITAGCMGM